MKAKPVTAPKGSSTLPRLDCTSQNYSQAALDMWEQATGLHYARVTPSPAKLPVAAADSE